MKALFIGDDIDFGRDIVSSALDKVGYISVAGYIDTTPFYLLTGDKKARGTDVSISEWMKKNNILWNIHDVISRIQGETGERVDCLIIQAETIFKDCKSPSDSPGLELTKHILLTDYPDLREIKIIVLSQNELHYLIRQKADNLILFSPYVNWLEHNVDPDSLGYKVGRIVSTYMREVYSEGEDYYRNLKNYVVILPEEETLANHNRRNLTGINSLYFELSGNEEQSRADFTSDVLSKDEAYVEDTWKLYHKKMVFKSRLEWKRNCEEEMTDTEFRVYRDILEKLGIKQRKLAASDWSRVFEDITNEMKRSKNTALVIEDKSYWIDFYKRILCENPVSKDTEESARNCIEQYAEDIAEWYRAGADEFCSCIKQQRDYSMPRRSLSFPDISIIDIYLSEKDEKKEIPSGIELISILKSINRLASVIVCSASKNYERIRKALKAGADELFVKDVGGLRNLLLKLYQLNHVASLRRRAGELIHLLEDESSSIPCLVPNDDESWHLYRQDKVLTIREMKTDERRKLVRDIELSLALGEDQVWRTVYDGFISDGAPESVASEVHDFWNQVLEMMARKFKKYTGKKSIHFGGINRTFDDTDLLLARSKPVSVKVTGREGDSLFADVVNTDYKATIDKEQVLQSGWTEEQFAAIKMGTILTACRRKYFGMPEELDSNTLIQMDLIRIDDKDEQ